MMRMDTKESEWRKWNWRSEGDLMVNGAFFVASGTEFSTQFAEASSMEPLVESLIEQLTSNSGVAALPSISNTNSGSTVPTGSNPDVTVPDPESNGADGTNPNVVGLVPPGSNGGGTNVRYGYNYGYNGYGPLYTSSATGSVPHRNSIVFTIIVVVLSFLCCFY